MENKYLLLNQELECLKQELYYLLDNEPWAKHDILEISKQLDDLILKYYHFFNDN